MRRAIVMVCAIAPTVLSFESTTQAAVMDFDTLALGTVFGSTETPPDTPGQIVFSQNGIDMFVEDFFFGGLPTFFKAEVTERFIDLFPTTHPLELNNISARFDFTKLGFEVNLVTIEFMEFGGQSNLAANNDAIHEVELLHQIHGTIVAPNVFATISDGLLTLTGDIESVRIGGQELVIDNVTAIPEPATVGLLTLAAAVAFVRRRLGGH